MNESAWFRGLPIVHVEFAACQQRGAMKSAVDRRLKPNGLTQIAKPSNRSLRGKKTHRFPLHLMQNTEFLLRHQIIIWKNHVWFQVLLSGHLHLKVLFHLPVTALQKKRCIHDAISAKWLNHLIQTKQQFVFLQQVQSVSPWSCHRQSHITGRSDHTLDIVVVFHQSIVWGFKIKIRHILMQNNIWLSISVQQSTQPWKICRSDLMVQPFFRIAIGSWCPWYAGTSCHIQPNKIIKLWPRIPLALMITLKTMRSLFGNLLGKVVSNKIAQVFASCSKGHLAIVNLFFVLSKPGLQSWNDIFIKHITCVSKHMSVMFLLQ